MRSCFGGHPVSDVPIAWLAFCFFAAFVLFAFGYIIGLGATRAFKDKGDEHDR